jgi:hypothetical protein
MATLYSTEATNENNPTAKNLLDADTAQASVVYSQASYVTTTALAASDEIRMIKIPEGYTPIANTFVVASDGVGATTCTVKVGTDLDTDSIIASASDVNTANVYVVTTSNKGAAVTTPVTTTADGWIVVLVAALTGTATAGKVINVSGCFAKA